jgi:hypothetical protein
MMGTPGRKSGAYTGSVSLDIQQNPSTTRSPFEARAIVKNLALLASQGLNRVDGGDAARW